MLKCLSTHLPRIIWLQLDGGQRGKTSREAHPLVLDECDAVEYDAVRQNQSHEGPAHRDQDCQTTIHTKDQGSVLWVKRGQRQGDAKHLHLMQHTGGVLVHNNVVFTIMERLCDRGENKSTVHV